MNIKGKLIIIGGAEDKGTNSKHRDDQDFLEDGILARIVKESRNKENSRFEIITSASTIPEEVGQDYVEAFGKLGCKDVNVLIVENREQAFDPELAQRMREADVVFATGGDQLRLTTTLGGTPIYDILLDKLKTEDDFIYAGTSAGAAAASDSMISKGNSIDAFLKGEVKTTTGFGFIQDVVFDTHFVQRGRIGRLLQLIVSNPKILGIGLEENTALMITEGNTKLEAIGTGSAILVDGRGIRNTNLLEIRERAPLSIDNLTLHVMSQTDIYDLTEHKLTIINSEDVLK
ncbi:MAG TPA: cyanophycinase [Flavobacterium sp.]|nr:cyanophycinase [Flavobacterium sp.]